MNRQRQMPQIYLANLAGFAILLFLLVRQLIGVAAGALQDVSGAEAPEWMQGLYGIVLALVSFLVPIFFMRKTSGIKIPLGRGRLPYSISLPFFLGFVLVLNAGTSLLQAFFTRVFSLGAVPVAALPQTMPGQLLYFLAICVLVPILEEWLFRGFVQKALQPWGRLPSVLLTSAFFALLHANLWDLITVFALSVLLCYCAEWSASLLPCILLHCGNNLLAFSFLAMDEGGTLASQWIFLGLGLLLLLYAALCIGSYRKKRGRFPRWFTRNGGAQRGRLSLGSLFTAPLFLLALITTAVGAFLS